jgi:hypothetical protein
MITLRAGHNLTHHNSNLYSIFSVLTLPTALWSVTRMVDLTPVKLQWQSEWKKFTRYEIEIPWLPHETPEEHQARHDEVKRQIQENYMQIDPSKRDWTAEDYEWDFEPDPKLGATALGSSLQTMPMKFHVYKHLMAGSLSIFLGIYTIPAKTHWQIVSGVRFVWTARALIIIPGLTGTMRTPTLSPTRWRNFWGIKS